MTDPVTQLATLRALRATVTDPAQGAALDALIANLESAEVAPQRQNISGNAQVGIAVAGSIHGNVYLDGRRGKTAAELLRAYLQRLAQRCGTLPLQGVREQKAADDVLRISLDQVYTQLATTALAEREVIAGPVRMGFDAAAYLAEHVGARVLPGQQRTVLRRPPTPQDRDHPAGPIGASIADARLLDRVSVSGVVSQELQQLDAAALARLTGEVEQLVFCGPQLVTEAIVDSFRLVLLGE